MEKHGVSCICYLSKTHFVRDFLQNSIGATPPPAPLAIPFTVRERSWSCKSQWNSIGNSSTSTTCNPIYIAGRTLQLQITMEFCPLGFPSVHPVVASISLLPNGALPKLFPKVSPPPTLSSLPSCSFPTDFFPSYYFPRFPSVQSVVASISLPPNGALPKLFPLRPPCLRELPHIIMAIYFPRSSVRPPCRRFRIASPAGKVN